MKNIVRLADVVLLVFVVSCKKKDGANQNLDPNKQDSTNYMSTKVGSWWLFGARNGEVTKRMATGRDSMKNGLRFSYFERMDTTSDYNTITPEYFGKNENKYLSLFDFDGGGTNYATLVFLMDDVNAGSSWTNTQDYTYGSYKLNLYVESNVEFVDGTLTLGNTTYTGVTKVHNKLKGKLQLQAGYLDAGKLDIWFAKGIGVIKQDVDINILSFATKKHTDSLLDYHIVN